MLARNEALEREVADAKEALADKEREIERLKNPPAPEPELRPTTTPTARTGQPTKAHGLHLAAELVSGSAARVKASLDELSNAPPIVTDAAAGAIAAYLRGGGANARAICEVYIANPPPRFGGASFHKILRAFTAASSSDGLAHLAEQAMAAHVTLGSDAKYLGKVSKEKATAASAGLGLRILSVFKRPWVIAVFWLPVLFGVVLLATARDARPIVGGAIGGLAVLVVVLDAYFRRCPSCKRWLAGRPHHVVRDQYDFHVTTFGCVFCKHTWTRSRYAGSN